jgi:hypothetical protein
VNVVCAATFLAAIGDIRRFKTSRQLVAYLGLDPKLRQSGSEPARIGHISKHGSPQTRGRWSKRRTVSCYSQGPCGHSTSESALAVATTSRPSRPLRKLACLFSSPADPQRELRARATITDAKKLRKLELIAGAKRFDGSAAGVWAANRAANRAVREAEKRLATPSGGVLRADGPRLAGHSTKKVGASATLERA